MPQPLNRVLPHIGPSIRFDPGALHQRKDFSSNIAIAINYWSNVELMVGQLLAHLMGTKAELAIAIHTALSGAAAQEAVLDAVVKAHVSQDDSDLYLAIKGVHKSVRTRRNDVAHGLWGISDDIPDGLLWMPTAIQLKGDANLEGSVARYMESMRAGKIPTDSPSGKFDISDVLVYRQADFDSLHSDTMMMYLYWYTFRMVFHMERVSLKGHFREGIERQRNWLCNEPVLLERLEKIRKIRNEP